MSKQIDCVVIGYNETPFAEYEALLRGYGADSEAYRDLRFSFVNINDQNMNYIGLLNHALKLANGGERKGEDDLKSCDIPNLAAVYVTHYLRMRGYEARYINLFQFEKDALASRIKIKKAQKL